MILFFVFYLYSFIEHKKRIQDFEVKVVGDVCVPPDYKCPYLSGAADILMAQQRETGR